MAKEEHGKQAEWLALSDQEFEEIRAKTELILRTIPTLLDKAEAEARATLALEADHTLESLSRRRIAAQLIDSAKGRLEQAATTRGLLAMLDSTWRCLAAVRPAAQAAVPDAPPGPATPEG